jgi:hypothetical protein
MQACALNSWLVLICLIPHFFKPYHFRIQEYPYIIFPAIVLFCIFITVVAAVITRDYSKDLNFSFFIIMYEEERDSR